MQVVQGPWRGRGRGAPTWSAPRQSGRDLALWPSGPCQGLPGTAPLAQWPTLQDRACPAGDGWQRPLGRRTGGTRGGNRRGGRGGQAGDGRAGVHKRPGGVCTEAHTSGHRGLDSLAPRIQGNTCPSCASPCASPCVSPRPHTCPSPVSPCWSGHLASAGPIVSRPCCKGPLRGKGATRALPLPPTTDACHWPAHPDVEWIWRHQWGQGLPLPPHGPRGQEVRIDAGCGAGVDAATSPGATLGPCP